MQLHLLEIVSAFLVLFAVIDIFGSLPIILDLKTKNGGTIHAFKAAATAYIILITFLFLGEMILKLFGVDITSFALAGAVILAFIAFEMIFGFEVFKVDAPSGVSIVPIAFPLIAGAGSFTTLLALRAEFDTINIIIALTLNMGLVYVVLRSTSKVERLLGKGGVYILKKFFGIILLAMAIKLFMTNFEHIVLSFIQKING